MDQTITIQAKTIGVRRPIIPQTKIPLYDETTSQPAPFTLRDLITQVVRTEVAAFKDRQETRRFARVLTERQIIDGARTGKINPAAQDLDQHVDLKEAIDTALIAFTDGIYYVFIDEIQIKSLDEILNLTPSSQVTFLRLVPLAGG